MDYLNIFHDNGIILEGVCGSHSKETDEEVSDILWSYYFRERTMQNELRRNILQG